MSSPPPPLPPVARDRVGLWARFRRPVDARWCVTLNLAACPGLGTWLYGRWEGIPQTLMMVAGFCLAMDYMWTYFRRAIALLGSANPDARVDLQDITWMGQWGFGLCVAAYIWAGISSIPMIRKARKERAVLTSTH